MVCPSLEARVQKGRVAAEGPSTGGGDSPRLNLQPDWSCSILDRGDASLKLATQGKLQPYDPSVLPVSAPPPPGYHHRKIRPFSRGCLFFTEADLTCKKGFLSL